MKVKKMIFIAAVVLMITSSGFAYTLQGQYYTDFQGNSVKLIGGDADDSTVSFGGKFSVGYYLNSNLAFDVSGGYGFVEVRDKDQLMEVFRHLFEIENSPYRTHFFPISLNCRYNILSGKSWVPFVDAGLGIMLWNLKKYDVQQTKMENFSGNIGGGIEYEFSRNAGLNFSFEYNHLFNQQADMSGMGDVQSGAVSVGIGFVFRFGGLKDTDKDGFKDNKDRCPYKKEDFDGFEDEDGCPDEDNDGDSLRDIYETNTGVFVSNEDTGTDPLRIDSDEDGLNDFLEIKTYKTNPTLKDSDEDMITDGDEVTIYQTDPLKKDTDEDGFDDGKEIEVYGTDPLKADSDGDDIKDSEDKCPKKAENFNNFQDNDGCPDTKPEIVFEKKAPIVLKDVRFKIGSSDLTDAAELTLDKVVITLKNYPEMRLKISGHTDNTGSRKFNLKLSKERAESVRRYLINNGVQEHKLTAEGAGPDRPVASNKTEEGRALNRRIEFYRLK